MTTQPLQLKHLTTKTAHQLSAISGELDITVAMLEKATAEKEALYRLFESLTPGGSEFHNSPQACVDFAKDRIKTTV